MRPAANGRNSAIRPFAACR